MINKNILFTMLLLALFIGTSILALYTAKKATAIHPHSTNNPDFFMTNATYIKFNSEGGIQNKIETSKITHFITNNTYLFEKPNMVIYNPGEEPWHTTANKGKSEKGKSKIYLWDKVKIIRALGINNADFDIATTALTIYPDIKFAETKEVVTIIQNSNITNAIGAKADFKTGIIKLISNIKALYQVK